MACISLRSLRPALRCSSVASTSTAPPLSRSYTQRSWADDGDDGSSSSPRPSKGAVHRSARQRMPRNPPPGPPPDATEMAKRAARQIKRAERLERKDLTAQLTPTKTYMGGFTQPRHLAFLNTLDPTRKEKDSHAVRVGPDRVRPSDEAYEPHIVYLAVTRYPMRWELGRAVRRETFSGICKATELETRFRELNYGKWSEARVMMVQKVKGRAKEPVEKPAGWACAPESQDCCDHAIWPGSPQERSVLNKPIHAARMARKKALAASPSLTQEELGGPLPSILPPVPGSWTPPPPPYLNPRFIVPLLTVTLPTRPLADTLGRLCSSHPRGLTFVASVPNVDRKDGPSFFRRLLRMRADRLRELTVQIVQKLQGVGGGLFGVRFKAEDKGRGVEGEMLGEEFRMPEEGWAEVRLLSEESDVWQGIEAKAFRESWKGLEGVQVGAEFMEDARDREDQERGKLDDLKWVEDCEKTVELESRGKKATEVEEVVEVVTAGDEAVSRD